jgi:hypothetical protein
MNRRVLYSFDYQHDFNRAAQVASMKGVDGHLSPSAEWRLVVEEELETQRWISKRLCGKSCVVVLIGSDTARQDWIKREIESAWQLGQGVLGIHIHRLRDSQNQQAHKGPNPLVSAAVGDVRLHMIAKTYDPPLSQSHLVFSYIEDNLADWVEEAIWVRRRHM